MSRVRRSSRQLLSRVLVIMLTPHSAGEPSRLDGGSNLWEEGAMDESKRVFSSSAKARCAWCRNAAARARRCRRRWSRSPPRSSARSAPCRRRSDAARSMQACSQTANSRAERVPVALC